MQSLKKLLARIGVAIQILVLSSGLGLSYLTYASADPYMVTLSGTVTGPGGSLLLSQSNVLSAVVDVYVTLPGQTDVITGTQDFKEGFTDAVPPGQYKFDVAPGAYDVHFEIPPSSQFASSTIVVPDVTITEPTILDEHFTAGAPTVTTSGVAQTAQGVPIKNGYVMFMFTQATGAQIGLTALTDSSGHYSASVFQNTTYVMSVVNSDRISGMPDYFNVNQKVVVGGNDLTFNTVLPSTVTANVLVKDLQGNTVPNAPVLIQAQGSGDPSILQPGSVVSTEVFTNAQGLATATLLGPSVTFGTACADYFAENIASCTNIDANSLNPATGQYNMEIDETPLDDSDAHSQGHQFPSPPVSDLAVSLMDGHPVLHWTSESPNDHKIDAYVVYRDGGQIAGGIVSDPPAVTETFIDEAALPGTHTYTLVGVDDGQTESLHSQPVSIMVPSPDMTPPTVGTPTWSSNPLLQGQNTTLSVPATDNLSGVASVQYSVNGGAAQAMTFDAPSNTWQATFGSTLAANTYNISVTATDEAGNTSPAVTDILAVYTPSNGYVTGHAKLVPTTLDTLPIARDTSNNPTKLVLGFTNVTAPASGSFDMDYSIKNNKNEFLISSTGINWVVVQDNLHASVLGHGDLTTYVNGVKTVTQNVAVRFDITLGTGGAPDQIAIKIYSPGVNPNTGSPAYVISDTVVASGSNLMIHL